MTVQTSDRAEALAGGLFDSMVGLMDLAGVYIGDRLGLYAELAEAPWSTSEELAERTGTRERYVREWLEHQAVSGLLDVEEGDDRHYRLPEGAEEVFLDPDSLTFGPPLARYGVGLLRPLDGLLQAFENGGGVPLEHYGDDVREGQAAINRPQFVNLLATEWLPAMPDVHARLASDTPARVADVCCGAGWSTIVMARAYPNARFDGFDLDAPAIYITCANAKAAGADDRVNFHVQDARDPDLAGKYDLVTVFEAIHALSQPVPVLNAMRTLAGDRGAVLVVDERAADRFTAPGDDMERALYGYSVLLCLPTAMTEEWSAATGTVMRADTLMSYAQEAGFTTTEILPVEHPQFRLYRLR